MTPPRLRRCKRTHEDKTDEIGLTVPGEGPGFIRRFVEAHTQSLYAIEGPLRNARKSRS